MPFNLELIQGLRLSFPCKRESREGNSKPLDSHFRGNDTLKRFGWCVFLLLYGLNYVQAASIAIIKSESTKPYNEALEGFKSVVGGNIKEYDLQGDIDRGRQIIAEVISGKYDLVYTIGTKASVLAREQNEWLPVVFSMVSRPESYGLKQGNMAGVSINISPEAQFSALKMVLKQVKRIGVIYNSPLAKSEIEQAIPAAQKLGLELLPQAALSDQDVPDALRKILDKIDVLWLTMDGVLLTQLSLKYMILSATRNKIPVLGFSPQFVKNGALLALKTDYFDMGVQAGELAGTILDKQAAPGGKILPPRKITPVINMKVANFLGLEIDPQFLKQSEVYE